VDKRPWYQRYLRHPLEAALAFLLLGLLRLVPADWASGFGGWLGRTLGPRLGVSRRARQNIELAFPGIQPAERERILGGMWDNLGRMLFEYPHLGRLSHPDSGRVEVVNEAPIEAAYHAKRPGVYFGAHLGNFEVLPLYAARRGLILTAFARAPNNPLIDRVVTFIRGTGGARILNKGSRGALGAIEVMRSNGYLAVLIDQKQNRGVAIPFFGHDAMTATAPAKLALRFKAVVVTCRIERLKGARWRFTVSDPLELPDSGDAEADAIELTRRVTAEVEAWIRAKPEDWFWLHRRWPKALYR
jgi:KDO2-lipid IV(A) lauroyltransferase